MPLIFPSSQSALSLLNRRLKSAKYHGNKYFIIVDENSYTHCLPRLVAEVEPLQQAEFLEVPVGEECKSIEIAAQLWSTLLQTMGEQCIGPNDLIIINLGGGCVSDLGGFVAAGLKRGVRYINVPTTLVSMVDAAIGGKTAINMNGAKNQVGFFHQPELTVIEPAFLETLPEAELKSGLFEVMKTLLLCSPELYAKCRDLLPTLPTEALRECALIKESVVKKDPNEQGIRKILNFGHTFGHAIEVHSHLSHGEAVGLGMACAMYLSVKKLGLPSEVLSSYVGMLRQLVPLPTYTLKDTEEMLPLMRKDKKCSDGLILCVLLQQPGVPVIDVAVDENEIRDTLLHLNRLA